MRDDIQPCILVFCFSWLAVRWLKGQLQSELYWRTFRRMLAPSHAMQRPGRWSMPHALFSALQRRGSFSGMVTYIFYSRFEQELNNRVFATRDAACDGSVPPLPPHVNLGIPASTTAGMSGCSRAVEPMSLNRRPPTGGRHTVPLLMASDARRITSCCG